MLKERKEKKHKCVLKLKKHNSQQLNRERGIENKCRFRFLSFRSATSFLILTQLTLETSCRTEISGLMKMLYDTLDLSHMCILST